MKFGVADYGILVWEGGFYDYEERGGIIITEWSENIPFAIPEKAVRVNIEKISETARRFTIC